MMEDVDQQPSAAPSPDNGTNYDFILSPDKQKKPGVFAFGKDPFIAKIIFIVGGAVVVMLAVWLIVTLVFGGKTNIDAHVALAQREQEIIRISKLGGSAASQQIKNAAVNATLSVTSHQKKLLAYLKTHDREVKPAELALKKDEAIDAKLKQAKQTSTFDTTYADIMRDQLSSYAAELKNAYNGESNKVQRQVLERQYNDAQLLLEQLPEN